MSTRVIVSAGCLLAAALAAAATFVALRVELEPLRASGGETLVAVTVQVAPEDRARVGRGAWLELELRRGERSLARLARAVELDEQGRARVEAAWPAGEAQLVVEVRGAAGDARGRWVDRVVVPALEAEPTPPPTPTVAPAPTPVAPPLETPPPPTRREPAAAPPVPVPAPAPATAAPVAAPTPVPLTPAPAALPTAAARAATPVPEGSGLAAITLIATRRNQPVVGLDAGGLRLELDGEPQPIAGLAGGAAAPLSLALAVDRSSTMAAHLPDLLPLLAQLALRVVERGGELGLVAADREAGLLLDWGATPAQVTEALAGAGEGEEGNLAGLLSEGMAALAGRDGRRLLLFVSDGGDTSSGADWDRASDAAAAAGAPILLLGLEGLGGRTGRSVERLVADSGGRSFEGRTADMLAAVLRHYGELLDGTYRLSFERPARASGRALRLEVEAVDRQLELGHPVRLR